jgi:hypothetical protein
MARRRHAKKGQVLVFENVLIFTISVAIFIVAFSVFNIYQAYFTQVGVSDQVAQVRDYIVSHVMVVSAKDAVNSSVTVKIPRTVGSEPYEIILSNSGLMVTSLVTGVSKTSDMYGLPYNFASRRIPSSRGKITIYKKANQIIIA